jgi:hypothetical protein
VKAEAPAVAPNSRYKLAVELFQIVAPFLFAFEAKIETLVTLAETLAGVAVPLVDGVIVIDEGLDKGIF